LEIIAAIFSDTKTPCHAEVAFGDYVYKRSLDLAAKLFAKKNSAGQGLDRNAEAQIEQGGPDSASAINMSPEEILIQLHQEGEEDDRLHRIREIVQSEEMPERAKIAFTYRFYGEMKIASKKDDTITISKLMGVTENTVAKYIDEAIDFIQKRLEK
jgi:DNA-directed RNA polymerase specialized sigma subunit